MNHTGTAECPRKRTPPKKIEQNQPPKHRKPLEVPRNLYKTLEILHKNSRKPWKIQENSGKSQKSLENSHFQTAKLENFGKPYRNLWKSLENPRKLSFSKAKHFKNLSSEPPQLLKKSKASSSEMPARADVVSLSFGEKRVFACVWLVFLAFCGGF